MKIEVKEQIVIDEGKHNGVIIAVEYREKPYEYTDVIIEFNDGLKLKAGYPTSVSEGTKLGKLLMRFGTKLEAGITVDPDKILIGKTCTFITMNEEKEGSTYARIAAESVKP